MGLIGRIGWNRSNNEWAEQAQSLEALYKYRKFAGSNPILLPYLRLE